ncbi:expressed unknown protein [Seminavis robusta]|uniref:Uncharacterized protein n=1 Tax=Seminavis robusta TaxID=568900 RepID=A0A9N8EVT4_9STRA|nr:expressed unknown protein [Seminavis robusta]|eukprot:Sro2162_g317190.1 n/a (405) ;mRNA; f:10497-11711
MSASNANTNRGGNIVTSRSTRAMRRSNNRNSYNIRRELSSTLSGRLERRHFRDEWIDSQHDLNVVVALVTKKDPSLKHIKIIQTFHGTLDISRFLDVLSESSQVETVAFVGVNMDDEYSIKLATAISSSKSSLSCLQLCRIIPSGLAKLCPALSTSHSLKELRLTFNHDLSKSNTALLMSNLGGSQVLEILKLYCIDLDNNETTSMVANAVKSAKSLTDLRITSCNLSDITCLVDAIQGVNRLERVDLSMNRISDFAPIAKLWECKTITFLSLSQNELGAQELGSSRENTLWKERQRHFDCLANNCTLKKMYLDMNPLNQDHVELLTNALQQNTTLMRLGLLTLTISHDALRRIRYLISLNSAGRGRIQHGFPDQRLMPHLLARFSKEPHLIYGLLTQTPHAWM